MPVRILIRQAYGQLQDFQLVGGPDWINSDRFDIEAKPEGGGPMSPQVLQSVFRQILEDRFALKVHKETRELPIYALVLARSDGRLGPNLKPSSPECSTLHDRARPGPCADGRGGRRLMDVAGSRLAAVDHRRSGWTAARWPRRSGPRRWSLRRRTSTRLRCAVNAVGGFGRMRAGGATMEQFADDDLRDRAARRHRQDRPHRVLRHRADLHADRRSAAAGAAASGCSARRRRSIRTDRRSSRRSRSSLD